MIEMPAVLVATLTEVAERGVLRPGISIEPFDRTTLFGDTA